MQKSGGCPKKVADEFNVLGFGNATSAGEDSAAYEQFTDANLITLEGV
jgi:hypothetical protein